MDVPAEDLCLRGIYLDPSENNLKSMKNVGLCSERADKGLVMRLTADHSCLLRGRIPEDGADTNQATTSSMWPGVQLPQLKLDGSEDAYKAAGIVLDRCIPDARKIILHMGSIVLEVRTKCAYGSFVILLAQVEPLLHTSPQVYTREVWKNSVMKVNKQVRNIVGCFIPL